MTWSKKLYRCSANFFYDESFVPLHRANNIADSCAFAYAIFHAMNTFHTLRISMLSRRGQCTSTYHQLERLLLSSILIYFFFFIILFSFSLARLILRENVTTKKNISNLFNEYIMEWPEWTRGLSVTSVNSITSAPRLSVNRSICASRRSFFFFFFFFFFHWHSTCLAFVSPTR